MGDEWPNGSEPYLLDTLKAESGFIFFLMVVILFSIGNISMVATADQLLLTATFVSYRVIAMPLFEHIFLLGI